MLEASFILYRLRPDFRNFNKRVVKTPKLYFYDTGLACSLLEIDSASQLKSHFARGSLFENLVINEFMKSSLNQGKEPRLSFWRDNVGHEVDLIQDRGGKPYAYEIKSAETFNWEFLDNLNFWGKISGYPHEQKFELVVLVKLEIPFLVVGIYQQKPATGLVERINGLLVLFFNSIKSKYTRRLFKGLSDVCSENQGLCRVCQS